MLLRGRERTVGRSAKEETEAFFRGAKNLLQRVDFSPEWCDWFCDTSFLFRKKIPKMCDFVDFETY